MKRPPISTLSADYKQPINEKHNIGEPNSRVIYFEEPRCWRCRLKRLAKVAAE